MPVLADTDDGGRLRGHGRSGLAGPERDRAQVDQVLLVVMCKEAQRLLLLLILMLLLRELQLLDLLLRVGAPGHNDVDLSPDGPEDVLGLRHGQTAEPATVDVDDLVSNQQAAVSGKLTRKMNLKDQIKSDRTCSLTERNLANHGIFDGLVQEEGRGRGEVGLVWSDPTPSSPCNTGSDETPALIELFGLPVCFATQLCVYLSRELFFCLRYRRKPFVSKDRHRQTHFPGPGLESSHFEG